MNGIEEAVNRRVDFIHIPVPREAHAAFFEPLRTWRHSDTRTRLYLGLLQEADAEGNQARIAAARTVVSDFGVAAECGFGRRHPSHIPAILEGHRAAAESIADTHLVRGATHAPTIDRG
jgi:hypothetical protein